MIRCHHDRNSDHRESNSDVYWYLYVGEVVMIKKSGVVISDEKQHDGLFHSVNNDLLNLPIMHEITPFVKDYKYLDEVQISKRTYRNTSMYFFDEENKKEHIYNFWVPIEEKFPQLYIMGNLIKKYVK